MYPIVIATVLLTVLGILGAVLLVAASKFLAVSEDETVEQLQAVLPGANCGGCGYAGCSAYAKAIAEGAPVNQCTVGGQAVESSDALKTAVQGFRAGDQVTFTVYRDGDSVDVTVTLDEDNQTTQEAMDALQQEYQEQQQSQQQSQQGNNFYYNFPFGW